MCGIVGYIGHDALTFLINGLKNVEYRGYDSAGIMVMGNGNIKYKKVIGKVEVLEKILGVLDFNGTIGIAHTRWATHGAPSQENAHPHTDCKERIFLVHNGIVENHRELKNHLVQQGHTFSSETDTEVIAHLIENFLRKEDNFKKAFFKALKMIRGAYALLVVDSKNPTTLYASRLSSPLIIGIGDNEYFVSSDKAAFMEKTRRAIYLNDSEVAEITTDGVHLFNLDKQPTDFEIVELEWDLQQAQKGDFPHFMLKEIFEGPDVIRSAFRGRLNIQEKLIKLGGLEQSEEKLKEIKRLIIMACGTSYYAGLIGEYFFEEIAKIPTEVHFASEFRYRDEPFDKGTVALAISQSGETADTLGALQKAKERNLFTLGIVNVVGSAIARGTDAGIYNHSGPEIGVASTKAFLSQLSILALMAIYLSKDKDEFHQELLVGLESIPSKIEEILKNTIDLELLAQKYKKYKNFLFLGRKYNYPTALEGALKLKEISYIHAEGYGAGEMKHGPIALIDENFPTIAIVPHNGVAKKMYSNLEEIKARKGPIIAIATEGDEIISKIADDVFYVPKIIEPLEPFLMVVPLQLFAYYMGVALGLNVDKPRNLAKSVTVE